MSYLGILMLIAPFTVGFLLIAKSDGLKTALIVYGMTAFVVGWVAVAVNLMQECKL